MKKIKNVHSLLNGTVLAVLPQYFSALAAASLFLRTFHCPLSPVSISRYSPSPLWPQWTISNRSELSLYLRLHCSFYTVSSDEVVTFWYMQDTFLEFWFNLEKITDHLSHLFPIFNYFPRRPHVPPTTCLTLFFNYLFIFVTDHLSRRPLVRES